MGMNEPIRIAQVTGVMNSGGVEAMVMNYYRAIDKSEIQFDFFVDETCSFPQRAEIEALGGRYYLTPPYSRPFAYIRTLKKLFRKNDYSIVHSHINTMNVFPLFAAWLAGVPVRICHNHSTANWGEGVKTLLKYLLRPFAKLFATDYFACGEKAGRWMYGNRCFDAGKVHIMPNAIDTAKFAFDSDARERLREALGAKADTLVVGHVGRFTFAKNHSLLIDIFAALHRGKADSILVLIGEGELEQKIRDKVDSLGLSDCVRFLGVRNDVNKLYSAMDVFCLPSCYEGLPVVLIEAQANGLPCVASDVVTAEALRNNRIGLSDCLDRWTQTCMRCCRAEGDCLGETYDIRNQAARLKAFYLEGGGHI